MSAPGRKLSAVIDEGTIASLVDAFYGRVRQDAILAPVFVRVVGTSEAVWADHLATLRDFWSSSC